MDSKKGRKPNSTDKQKNMLVDFIVFHPELVSGKNTIKSTVKQRQKLWENIANMLNSEVGLNKSWNEWRKTWCDLKTNTKGKAGIIRKEQNKTGGGEVDYSELTELEKKIFDVLGPTVVEGHNSVTESPADMSFFKTNVQLSEDTIDIMENRNGYVDDSNQQLSSNDLVDGDIVEELIDNGLGEITEVENDMRSNCFSSVHLLESPIRSNSRKIVGKKERTLSHTVEATRSLASISSERTKLKANYYKQKLLLLERQTVAKEKKADALALIAESIAAKYKT